MNLRFFRLTALQRAQLAAFAIASASVFSLSCSNVTKMRGELEGLEKLADQAERNGAIRCAPRELALAKANIRFADAELGQGNWVRGDSHLGIARANAQAAYDLSPPQKCAERGIVEEPLPPPKPAPGDCDGDGFLDDVDVKCQCDPETFNGFEDEDGCPDDPDTDGDGLKDSVDSCRMLPEDKDNYLDDDGCPELDNDSDTILDVNDKDSTGKNCANEPEDPDGYEDADGCPEPDNDGDKVADLEDQCPNEAGPPGGDKPGCPKKPSLVIVTATEIKITQQIHFEFDKDIIRKESYAILDAVVEVLVKNPKIKIEIQGHTDNKGSPVYNKALSDRRAASVKKYLVGHGVEAGRLTSKGYGMEVPIVPNTNDQNRALNRRVQFVRTEGAGAGTPP
ncbi:MAG: OmpA family protein [Polyangiaceae bacterium]|nr:OmpA family protein [Polyangiaceae bacterium]